MIVLDKETSGLSPVVNGVLSIGAVHFKTGKQFYGECRLTEGRVADPGALKINGFTLEEINNPNKPSDIELYLSFVRWAERFLDGNILGGHNVGHFDILFTEEIYSRAKQTEPHKFPFSYRTVDLHSIAYAVFGKSLTHAQICVELGLEPEPQPHNALSGAISEAKALEVLLKRIQRI